MSVTFLLLVHEDPAGVARLVERLRAPGHRFVVHVDRRAPLAPFRDALRDASQAPEPDSGDVILLGDDVRMVCHWAGWSICIAMLLLLTQAQRRAPGDWYPFLSGADYPLVHAGHIESHFRRGGARLATWREITADKRTPWLLRKRVFALNFNDTPWLNRREIAARDAWTRWPATVLSRLLKVLFYALPARRAPGGIRLYRGSQWSALSAAECDRVLAWLAGSEGRQLAAFLAHAAAPDELLLPTVMRHLDLQAGNVDVAQAGVLHATHWIDWRNGLAPAAIDAGALPGMIASGALFCRKLPPASTPAGQQLRMLIDQLLTGDAL